MLTRQCGRHGRAPLFAAARPCSSPRFRCTYLAMLSASSSSIWITEECVRRAFQSFFSRRISSSQPRCEFDNEDYSRRLLRRRMSMTRMEAIKSDQFQMLGHNKWDETPPTFSWSTGQLPRVGIGSADPGVTSSPLPRPEGVHYQIGDTGSLTSRFLSSIFQPITSFFPSLWQDTPPPPPPPLSISTPSTTQALAKLEAGIKSEKKSMRWILAEYKQLKKHAPYLQLSSRMVVLLFEKLLAMRYYTQFLEVIETEDLVAVKGVDFVRMSLEKFDDAKKKEILEDLCELCKKEQRDRFRGMLIELELRAQRDLHTAVVKETTMMLSQIMGGILGGATESTFAKDIEMATDVKMLCTTADRIIASKTKIGVKTSQAIFQRFIDLEGLDESMKYVINPVINVPETHNIAKICGELCERTRYRDAYNTIRAALKVDKFGFLSNQDILTGVRTVDTKKSERIEGELVALWEAVNKSTAVSVRDLSKNTFSAFIGRACRLKFGRRTQWFEGRGTTPLLKMCLEIIVLHMRSEVSTEHLATLLEAWIWNWQGNEKARIDTHSLDGSIPFMSHFLGVLSPAQLDKVMRETIYRVIANCHRKGDEVWPVRILWPLVASFAQNRDLWTSEESLALWLLEGVILRKGLGSKYLSFRTDAEIARFVVRHYLPFRIALENEDKSEKEKAKAVFFQLRNLESVGVELDPDVRAGIEMGIETNINKIVGPFATAILAFKGTGIPCRTLLLDMAYTLYRLGRPVEIVSMLRSLNYHTIRPSSSQYAHLIRTLTPEFPESALALLKLYAKSQYATFASYIATVARKHPHLALRAYRFLTRPNVFPYTLDQPKLSPRRRPKRRLLVAMAWKFANSPALSARQCYRWVYKCYSTMRKLGYAPGPTVGLALAVAAVQRTISEGKPIRLNGARQKWVLQVVKRQAGPKKAREVGEILVRYISERKESMRSRSPRW